MTFKDKDGIEVEAVRGDVLIDGQPVDFPDWIRGAMEFGVIVMARHAVQIHGPKGIEFAGRADWIVEGPDKAIFPIGNSMFKETFTLKNGGTT